MSSAASVRSLEEAVEQTGLRPRSRSASIGHLTRHEIDIAPCQFEVATAAAMLEKGASLAPDEGRFLLAGPYGLLRRSRLASLGRHRCVATERHREAASAAGEDRIVADVGGLGPRSRRHGEINQDPLIYSHDEPMFLGQRRIDPLRQVVVRPLVRVEADLDRAGKPVAHPTDQVRFSVAGISGDEHVSA